MSNEAILATVEKLAELLVFSDAQDLQGLAGIHTEFQRVGEWAGAHHKPVVQEACTMAADLIESVILGEGPSAEVLMKTLTGVSSGLQRVIRDGVNEAEAGFPEAPGEEEGAGTELGFRLPAHVDEDIFSDFLSRQDGVLDDMENLVLALEEELNTAQLGELKRLMHTLKGEGALLGLSEVERLCHAAEDGLSASPPVFNSDNLLSVRDWLKRFFDSCAGKGESPEGCDELLALLAQDGSGSALEPEAVEASGGKAGDSPVKESAAEDGLVFSPKPLDADRDLLSDFVVEAMEHLDNSDVQLLTLETEPQEQDALNAVFRAFHTIKGVAGFMALEEIQALAHDAENLLDSARKGERILEGSALDLVFDAVDVMKHCVENVNRALVSGEPLEVVPELPDLVRRIRKVLRGEDPGKKSEGVKVAVAPGRRLGENLVEAGIATESAVNEALQRQQELAEEARKIGAMLVEGNYLSSRQLDAALDIQGNSPEKRIGEVLVEMGALSQEELGLALDRQREQPCKPAKVGELLVRAGEADAREVAGALRSQKQQGARSGGIQVREAVKVDADRLDLLVDSIGELVIAESMVAQSTDLQSNMTPELSRHISQLDKITRELQMMAMSLRMVPVRATFQKMARLVRDLAKKTGKLVEFHMSGEDTELDKTVVDRIGDPLVHIIRNAVDHGIEGSAEDRKGAGKTAIANVYLRAFHAGGNIHIEVEDDGRGLDRQAILNKAVERGLVAEGADLPDRDVFGLIFEPGFSTAKQVTEVSGRGVGMDVVRRNIESLRGKTEIQSVRGKGSVFTIQLPLTLAIIDGMVVRVGSERFVLPTLTIVISIRPRKEDLHTVVQRGEMIKLQGSSLPLHRLHRVFRIDGAVTEPAEGTVLVVEHDGRRCGVLVDEILGQQQIVIKSLGEALKGLPGIAGGAIMPDGRVGLIIDVAGLVRLAEG